MSELLITIAIPTYNNAKTIQNTIESCLNQKTDIEYEVLVVNNASQDETKKILEQYNDQKLRVIHNDETLTMYDNHNVCLHNSFGQYVLFCHSDDVLENHAIEVLVNKLTQRNFPEKYVLWGHSMFRDFSKNIKNAEYSLNELIVGESAGLLFLRGGLTPSGTCYSRKSLLKLGGFLKVNHRMAPSDMTTMLYCALNGYRFEMTDEMIFKRLYASTAVNILDTKNVLASLDDAFIAFINLTSKNDIDKLLAISVGTKVMPFYFYYVIAQYPQFKKQIIKKIIRHLILHPFDIRHKVLHKTIQRLLFK